MFECESCVRSSVFPNCSFGTTVGEHTWHTFRTVYWLALLSVHGINAGGKEKSERKRERDGESLHSDSEGR